MTPTDGETPDRSEAKTSRTYMAPLSKQEKKSFTHSDFWIPEPEREIYKMAMRVLNEAAVPYVIAGAYAIYEHTGIYRETTDLDVFVEPAAVIPAAQALKSAGFIMRLEQPHWLAKAISGKHFVDVIYGMGNGMALIDSDWFRYSRPAILAATPVRVAPPEELLWHRLFIHERHRQDMADIVHLIVSVGHAMNWHRLLEKTGEHWPLLLSQLLMYSYVYPEIAGVPSWVMEDLLGRAQEDMTREHDGERVTRGTLVSRFSFAIDVNEWGFRDVRLKSVRDMENRQVIREIVRNDIWDERSRMTREYDARYR